jgi:hypothetical protein
VNTCVREYHKLLVVMHTAVALAPSLRRLRLVASLIVLLTVALASVRRLSALVWQTLACPTVRICYWWNYKSPHPLKSRSLPQGRLFSWRLFFAPSLRWLRSCAFVWLFTLHSYPIRESIARVDIAADDWCKPWTHTASVTEGESVTVRSGIIGVANTSNNNQKLRPSLQFFPCGTGIGLIMDSREAWRDIWTACSSRWWRNLDLHRGAVAEKVYRPGLNKSVPRSALAIILKVQGNFLSPLFRHKISNLPTGKTQIERRSLTKSNHTRFVHFLTRCGVVTVRPERSGVKSKATGLAPSLFFGFAAGTALIRANG